MSRVVVVGSVNLDLSIAVPHLPARGETVLGSQVTFRPGGKGGNQAVAARRLGADTVLVAAVGDDQFGTDLRQALAAEGLALHLATVDGASTGLAMIVVEGDGENVIVVSPGANELLTAGQVTTSGPPAGLLGPGTVLAVQLEIPLATCLEAARLARAAGATVVLNAAPLPKLIEPLFADLLGVVDVLVVNEGEALNLAGQPAAPADLNGWARLAARLCELGPSACVVTLGPLGAVCAGADVRHTQTPFAVDAIDSTGAGDAFCGALAVGLSQGRTLPEAVRRGCAAGALAATRMGAQTALPTAAELDRFLAEQGEVGDA